MERVLLLNQSYEPISIINWKKAIIMLTLGKVEVIEEYEKDIRSRFIIIKAPAVVRLLNIFSRPRKRVKFNRQNILARDRWCCQYCGKKFVSKDLTYDHVTPKSRGGSTCWENIVTCCISCNLKKGDRTPHEANMRIRKQPTKPDWVPIFTISISKSTIPDPWKSFCYWMDE
jgi:5-methylcytosine-specific restriction endonuclease McrA